MIHIKRNMAVCLALATLFTLSAPASARDENADPLTGHIGAFAENADSIKRRTTGGDPVAGKDLSQLCQGCHGEDGNSFDPLVPKLSGQYSVYIAKQLRNYQAGTRTHQIMNAMAATISDAELSDISSYFASQPKMKGDGSTNELGKTLYLKGNLSKMVVACVNCHGIAGKGLTPNTPMFPVLGGQHKAYLLKQLNDFQADDRANSPYAIMNRIVRSLSKAELEALAEYIAGQ